MKLEAHEIMDLQAHLFKTNRRIEIRSHVILFQCLDFCGLHTLGAHKFDGVFHELPAGSRALVGGMHGNIGNPTDAGLVVEASRNVADHVTGVCFEDKDPVGMVTGDIGIYVSQLAKFPVSAVDLTEGSFDVAVYGDAVKADGCDLFELLEVFGSE